MQQGKHRIVLFVQGALGAAVQIPKAQNGDRACCSCVFGKCDTGADIVLKCHRDIVCFKGMQGNADLVRACTLCKQCIAASAEQCAVGGQHRMKARGVCLPQKFGQQRMRRRFSHQMKIEIIGPWAQLFGQMGKFGLCHCMRTAFCARTECAGKVADIGDLKICFMCRHGCLPDKSFA